MDRLIDQLGPGVGDHPDADHGDVDGNHFRDGRGTDHHDAADDGFRILDRHDISALGQVEFCSRPVLGGDLGARLVDRARLGNADGPGQRIAQRFGARHHGSLQADLGRRTQRDRGGRQRGDLSSGLELGAGGGGCRGSSEGLDLWLHRGYRWPRKLHRDPRNAASARLEARHVIRPGKLGDLRWRRRWRRCYDNGCGGGRRRRRWRFDRGRRWLNDDAVVGVAGGERRARDAGRDQSRQK